MKHSEYLICACDPHRWYYYNQWVLDEPVMERVDSTVNFDGGSGRITQYGNEYVSVRCLVKVLPDYDGVYIFVVSDYSL